MVRNVVRNSPTHAASSIKRLLAAIECRKKAQNAPKSCPIQSLLSGWTPQFQHRYLGARHGLMSTVST